MAPSADEENAQRPINIEDAQCIGTISTLQALEHDASANAPERNHPAEAPEFTKVGLEIPDVSRDMS